MSVDENVGDGGVVEQGLKGTEAEDLVHDFFGERVAIGGGERDVLLGDELRDGDEQLLAAAGVVLQRRELLEIDAANELLMDLCLELMFCSIRKRQVVANLRNGLGLGWTRHVKRSVRH